MLTIPCSPSKQHPNRYASLYNDGLIGSPLTKCHKDAAANVHDAWVQLV